YPAHLDPGFALGGFSGNDEPTAHLGRAANAECRCDRACDPASACSWHIRRGSPQPILADLCARNSHGAFRSSDCLDRRVGTHPSSCRHRPFRAWWSLLVVRTSAQPGCTCNEGRLAAPARQVEGSINAAMFQPTPGEFAHDNLWRVHSTVPGK